MPGNNNTLWKITILLGLIAAVLGLVLRLYFAWPLPFNFKYLLHAHSHTMLLGWLLPALVLLIYRQWGIEIPKTHKRIFYVMAIAVVGMLLSFPFHGYAAVSIAFSTLHLWLTYVLLFKIFNLSRGHGVSGKLVQTGVILFYIASIGPYSLGPLMANQMQNSPWYDQAIFFYLHFLYNGAFFFFILAYIIKKLGLTPNKPTLFYIFMLLGTVLTWFHKLDYSFNFWWINMLAAIGSILQLWAGFFLLKSSFTKKPFSHVHLILVILSLKWVFQLFGSFPPIANEVVDSRFILIAYLHFIFLGIFTPLIWDALKDRITGFKKLMAFYWLSFLLTELALVLPSLNLINGFIKWPQITFALYTIFVSIWCILGFRYLLPKQQTPIP
jgi:hypothetical protein